MLLRPLPKTRVTIRPRPHERENAVSWAVLWMATIFSSATEGVNVLRNALPCGRGVKARLHVSPIKH
jgi:hypothetical protein